MELERRQRAFARFERATDVPMTVISLLIVPMLVIPFVAELPDAAETALLAADYGIWALFAVELGVKTYLEPDRRSYLISHWYDVVIVIVPFLRPLRALRVVRALRLGALLMRAHKRGGRLFGRHSLHYAVLTSVIFVIGTAGAVSVLEEDTEGTIADFGTALWWATATVTTVGYGDTVPVSTEGRVLGVALMLVGIGFFGILTANIAAFFLESENNDRNPRSPTDDVMTQLHRLEDRIADLQETLTRMNGDAAAAPPPGTT